MRYCINLIIIFIFVCLPVFASAITSNWLFIGNSTDGKWSLFYDEKSIQKQHKNIISIKIKTILSDKGVEIKRKEFDKSVEMAEKQSGGKVEMADELFSILVKNEIQYYLYDFDCENPKTYNRQRDKRDNALIIVEEYEINNESTEKIIFKMLCDKEYNNYIFK